MALNGIAVLRLAALGLGAALAAAAPVAAQQVITREQLEPQRPERIAPQRPDAPALDIQRAPEEPLVSAGPQFTLRGLDIAGSSVYGADRFEALFADSIGQPVDFAGLRTLSNRIEELYREDGYIAVRAVIPAQRIADGIVRIEVIEAAIAEVVLRGELGRAEPEVRRLLDSLVGQKPLRAAAAERQLLLARDLPGVSLLAALRARQSDTPGELVLLAEGVLTRLDGFVSVSNLGSEFAGPFVATGGAGVNSVALPGDRLDVIALTSLEFGEEALGQISYETPVGPDGLTVRLSASNTVSETGGLLEVLDIDYRSEIVTAGFNYKLIRTRDRTLTIGGGFDYVHQESNAVLPSITVDEDLRVLFGDVRLIENDLAGGVFDASATLRGGLDILGASGSGDRRLTGGPDTDPQFVSAGFDLRWSRLLGEGFSLDSRVLAQVSSGNLPTFERFSLGNYTVGRGFDPGAASGDHGVAGLLAISYALDLPQLEMVAAPSVFAFVDSGRVWSDGPVDSRGLTSLGAGARWQMFERVDIEALVAVPVQSSDLVEDDGVQGLFRVTTFF